MGTHPRFDGVGRLLFGAVRRDVLALLYGRPDESFYLREIQRAVGAGIGPVQRELRLLSEAGLIERLERGNHVYFSANRNAPIFGELQAILEKTAGAADVLRASLGPLLAAGRIDAAFIYGSVAEGKQTAASDVDLFVLGDATLAELVPAVRAAEARLGRDVNPSVYGSKDLRAALRRRSPFVRRVLKGPKLMIIGDYPVATTPKKTAQAKPSPKMDGDWREATLARMRELIFEADPAMVEEQKWKKPSNGMKGVPLWSHDGMVCTGETYKGYVKLTFAYGAKIPDPSGLFNASLEGGTRRAIDIREGETVDARAFKALVKAAVKHNAQGKKER